MTVYDFEQAVWEKEGIRIVVRAPWDDQVQDYDYVNAAQANWRVTQFLENRILPRVGNRQAVVISGFGKHPHGGTHLSGVRDSYRPE